jgi:SPP1 family predicted phage head-tail adaptor
MQAGSMDVLVSLQSYAETIDANTGEKLQTWTEYATAWAQRVEQESGSEQVNADRREHKQIVYYTIRFNSAVGVKHRVVDAGLNHNIVNIANLARNLYLKLQTELTE